MRNSDGLTPGERELETVLGHLRPAPPVVDRDLMLFRAGQASMRTSLRWWRSLSLGLAVAFGASVTFHAQSRIVERRDYVDTGGVPVIVQQADERGDKQTVPTPLAGREGGYLRLQRRLLTEGVDWLDTVAAPGGGKTLTPRDITNLLNQPVLGT